MPGAILDRLTPLDRNPEVTAPRPGTTITAYADNPDDGPIRPALQQLLDRTYYLFRGVVEGARTVRSLTATKVPDIATITPAGMVFAEGDMVGLADARFDSGQVIGDVVRALSNLYAAAGVFAQWARFDTDMQIGSPTTGLFQADQTSLYWVKAGGITNPKKGDTLKNRMFAAQVLKYQIKLYIVAGRILAEHGPGRWSASFVDLGAGTRTRFRIRIKLDDAMADDHYVPHFTWFNVGGTLAAASLGPFMFEVMQDTMAHDSFDFGLYAIQLAGAPPAAVTLANIDASLATFSGQIGITLWGSQT